MKILLDIPDNKAKFFLEVLKSFSFVKKATPLTDYKAELLQDLREAVEEMQQIKAGHKKARSAQDFLHEL